MKPDQGTETRNVHYPLIYPAIYLPLFCLNIKPEGRAMHMRNSERQRERDVVEVSGFF
jgi:hypothetical protein